MKKWIKKVNRALIKALLITFATMALSAATKPLPPISPLERQEEGSSPSKTLDPLTDERRSSPLGGGKKSHSLTDQQNNPFAEEQQGGDTRFMQEFMNMLTTLGLMIAVLVAGGWLVKKLLATRMKQTNTTSTIKVMERRTLTARTAIYLLDIEGQQIAIAESHNGVTLLFQRNNHLQSAKTTFEQLL